jgi:uncharacterized membrane protein YuzA (DUF378 family)
MVASRVIEIIAGVSAVIFVLAMIWSDSTRDSVPRRERMRPLQYSTALIVLVCAIVLGMRSA